MDQNRNTRKKDILPRLIAFLLCCVFLGGVMFPTAVIASPTEPDGEPALADGSAAELQNPPADTGIPGSRDSVESALTAAGAVDAVLKTGTEETVTITFAINNENYTNDPGSGNTHLTSTSIIEGGELTYTQWADRHKVTGTGTICSYTIPAATSLADNGLSAPALTVENIETTNTYSYSSSYSWVTADGRICNVNTAFQTDTTLYLYLYESEYYHLDFVCCEEHNYSISGALSGYPLATFALGQSVSQQYIPTADAVNSGYHNDSHAQTFAGWQLKVTQTGEMVDFQAGTPITADYTDTAQYGNTVKVYAVWESAPVTATFCNGDETVETRPLVAGDALGELPDLSELAPEGQSFLGWQYTDSDGNLQYATAQTRITEDTTFTAVFGEATYYNVVFHDIRPDETETDITIDLSVQEGTSLSDAMALSDAALEDGTLLSDCIWYTVAQDGSKTRVDPAAAAVTEDLELSTYTYQIVLTLRREAMVAAAKSASLELETSSDGTFYMTITAREGEKLSASDFLIDGVDYSLYAWTYRDEKGNEQTLDIQALIREGVSENITATSTGTLVSSALKASEGHIINFYIFIDGQRVLLETRSATSYTYNEGNRRYLSAATLESVYGKYGFTSTQLTTGTHYFPHTDAGDGKIWADADVLEVDGAFFSPVTQNTNPVDVYYLPKQTLATGSGAWTAYQTSGTFYTVKVVDPGHKVYANDTLPETTYAVTGTSVTVTVENAEGVTWQGIGQTSGAAISGTDNGDGTTSFTISRITQPYVISPALEEGETLIDYNIHLPKIPADAEYGTPTIGGSDTYTTLETGASHTVLAPSMDSYFYTYGKYLGKATFLGWAVNGDTTNLVQPNTALDLSDSGGTVTLTAQWAEQLGGTEDKEGPMVNFFVSLVGLPEGTVAWSGSAEKTAFTKSVYTTDCGVNGGIVKEDLKLYDSYDSTRGQYYVLGSTSGSDLNEIHDTITNSLSTGYTRTGSDGKQYTFTASFPTDEEVLRTVRQMVNSGTAITINGRAITADELTTENFTIKWHVFKYDIADGWHIDGILVAKKGQLKVTKTFAGDTDAINAVKKNYSVSVTASAGAVHTGETLSLSNAVYDESTNTYTWLVDVDQYYDYTVSENNYQSAVSLMTTTAKYFVRNSHVSAQNTDGWQTYSSGVTVTGRGYQEGDSERLTVAFLNTYTAPGTLILQKTDAVSGNYMSGVSFTIGRQDGTAFTMYRTGSGHYSADPASGGTATTTITTDYSGQAYLWIGGGIYTLEEQVPTGYDDPGKITVKLEGDAANAYKVINISGVTAANGSRFVEKGDSLEVVVKNYSRTIDLTVEKIWADGENKPVTLQLYRNGRALGSAYAVTLDGKTDTIENTAWKCLFADLPLYADGDLAQYTIREEAIGDFRYSDQYPDGYRYYDVTYSGMSYLDANGDVTTDMTDVAEISLSVTNRRSTGALEIRKTDADGAALAGAEFWLYEVPALSEESTPSCTVIPDADGHNVLDDAAFIKSAVSDSGGLVSFGNMQAARYYLVEHAAPGGYDGSDDLYMLILSNTGTAMYRWNVALSSWDAMSENAVVNTPQIVDVTITKEVTGLMGDRSKTFDFVVSCTEPMAEGTDYTLSADGKQAEFSLGHGDAITLQGVQKGAVLTITETGAEDYTMTVSAGTSGDALSGNSFTIPDDSGAAVALTVTNDKDGTPDSGILLDSLPYLLILVIVAAGVVWFLKRRGSRRDD